MTPWSDDEQRLMVELLEAGHAFPHIATILGRNADAVRSRALQTGVWQAKRRASTIKRPKRRFDDFFGD